MDTFGRVIDNAAEKCGGQNALARELNITSGWLSEAKHGKKTLPKEKLTVLAALIDADPAFLWELQELANLPRRNPFKQALSATLAFFFAVNLSLGQNEANAAGIDHPSQIDKKTIYTLSIRPVLLEVLRLPDSPWRP
jgi:hypothetical protein